MQEEKVECRRKGRHVLLTSAQTRHDPNCIKCKACGNKCQPEKKA